MDLNNNLVSSKKFNNPNFGNQYNNFQIMNNEELMILGLI